MTSISTRRRLQLAMAAVLQRFSSAPVEAGRVLTAGAPGLAPTGFTMRLPVIRSAVIAAAAAIAVAPQASAQAAGVPIAGTITAVADGACTPPTLSGPLLSWQCAGGTENYEGGLASTADAVFDVSGTFNTRSGATRTRGTQTFTGCVQDACGTLEWRWRVTFSTDPETATVIRGQGQARITGSGGGLAGARGSFTIKCLPEGCTYSGLVFL